MIQSTNNPHISPMVLDVSSTASIKYFAEQFIKATIPPLHAIVCNAGAGFAKGTQVTADGVEATFGVNHLGHFLLVRLLLNQIEEQGRIIIVSSDTHDPSKKTGMPAPRYASPDTLAEPVASDQLLANLSDLSKGQIRYTTSKLCNLYFTYELTNRIRKSKRSISIVTFNPGMMPSKGSALTRNYKPFQRFMWNNVMPLMRFVHPGIRSTKQSGNDLANLIINSGTYWDGRKQIPSSEESYNKERATGLWNWSSERFDLEKDI